MWGGPTAAAPISLPRSGLQRTDEPALAMATLRIGQRNGQLQRRVKTRILKRRQYIMKVLIVLLITFGSAESME